MAYPTDTAGIYLLSSERVNGFGPFKSGHCCTFALKSEALLPNLPDTRVILAGSTAIVRPTGQTYMLEDDNTWKPL